MGIHIHYNHYKLTITITHLAFISFHFINFHFARGSHRRISQQISPTWISSLSRTLETRAERLEFSTLVAIYPRTLSWKGSGCTSTLLAAMRMTRPRPRPSPMLNGWNLIPRSTRFTQLLAAVWRTAPSGGTWTRLLTPTSLPLYEARTTKCTKWMVGRRVLFAMGQSVGQLVGREDLLVRLLAGQ